MTTLASRAVARGLAKLCGSAWESTDQTGRASESGASTPSRPARAYRGVVTANEEAVTQNPSTGPRAVGRAPTSGYGISLPPRDQRLGSGLKDGAEIGQRRRSFCGKSFYSKSRRLVGQAAQIFGMQQLTHQSIERGVG